MKYSLNPFKWILWLWRRWKWRKRTRDEWRSFYRPSKPLSRKGRAMLLKKMKAAWEKMKESDKAKASALEKIREATKRGYWGVNPDLVIEFCRAGGDLTDAEAKEVVEYSNRRREERMKVFPHFEKLGEGYGNE